MVGLLTQGGFSDRHYQTPPGLGMFSIVEPGINSRPTGMKTLRGWGTLTDRPLLAPEGLGFVGRRFNAGT